MGQGWSGCQGMVVRESYLKGSRGSGGDSQGVQWRPCRRRWVSVSREPDLQAK